MQTLVYEQNLSNFTSCTYSQMDVLEQERLLAEVVEEMNSMLDECMILFEAVSGDFVLLGLYL